MSQTWLSIVEYARAFNMSDMTVRRRIKTGKLESVLKEGKYFIPVSTAGDGSYIKSTKDSMKLALQSTHSTTANSMNQSSVNPLTGVSKIVSPRPTHLNTNNIQEQFQDKPVQQKVTAPAMSQPTPPVASHIQAPSTNSTPSKLKQDPKIAIDAQNLVDLCNNIISETKKKESIINSRYQAQINALNSEIHVKNIELSRLEQQIEDLQLLTKMLEKEEG